MDTSEAVLVRTCVKDNRAEARTQDLCHDLRSRDHLPVRTSADHKVECLAVTAAEFTVAQKLETKLVVLGPRLTGKLADDLNGLCGEELGILLDDDGLDYRGFRKRVCPRRLR